MAVYVDDMRVRSRASDPDAVFCRLTADDTEELHAFAARIGLTRELFKPAIIAPDTPENRKFGVVGKRCGRDHYDVIDSARRRAVAAGAVEVEWGREPWRDRSGETW